MEDAFSPTLSQGTSPRCVTYSVSFCDKILNDQGDSSRLLGVVDENPVLADASEVPAIYSASNNSLKRSESISVPRSSRQISGGQLNSCPDAAETNNFGEAPAYGSLPPFRRSPAPDGAAAPRRIIYCVHGKLSGCCVVSEGEVIERAGAALPEPPAVISGEHCHRTRDEKVDQKARRKLIVASVLCVVFMIGEIVGGYLSSSLAIATDAAHLLTDFASFMISLFSLWVASRPATRRMSFGWYRAEVIGALTSVLMIWIVTGVLVYLAVERIVERDFAIDAKIMLITSAIGVVVNLVMGLTLHQHGHQHAHPQRSIEAGPGDEHSHGGANINVRAAFIHVVGDFIQSFGVFIAALVIYFKPTWIIVDPICTFLFSILVIMTTFAIIKDTLVVLMEGIPKGIDFSEVMNTFLQIDGVIRVHNLRIWALSMDKTALSAHLAVRPGVSPQEVLTLASRNVHERFNFFEMTLQIEEFDQNMEECTQCKCPES